MQRKRKTEHRPEGVERIKAIRPWLWRVCQKCKNEFRREPGWHVWFHTWTRSRIVGAHSLIYSTIWRWGEYGYNGTINTYYCTKCCPTEEDVIKEVEDNFNCFCEYDYAPKEI